MSEYQYYEFRAVDRPLNRTEQGELRAISTRARITATGFVNHYEWGDFKGDPDRLMARYFDLFLYFANFGSRRLSIRLPGRLLDAKGLKRFTNGNSSVAARTAGDNLIVDVVLDEIEAEYDDRGDGWLDALAPLRDDILDGDLRPFYLMWLMAVESGDAPDDAIEPLAGIGPLTPSHEAFAQFFCIDGDLVNAAAEAVPEHSVAELSRQAVAEVIDSLAETEKAAYLLRLYDGDPLLRAELRRRCRAPTSPVRDQQPRRNAGELRATAERLKEERRGAEAKRALAAQRKREREEAKARDARLDALARRGAAVAWRDVEELISQRNNLAYDKTVALLGDLRDLALRQGTDDGFRHRLVQLRTRHRTKPRLIQRLAAAGLD
jgi:predicted Holliday junction resolvase-like endonuclease